MIPTPYSTPTEPGENVLDSRDLVARQQEIEDEFELDYEVYPGPAEFAAAIRQQIRHTGEGSEDVADEYEQLYDINQQGEQAFGSEWDFGVTLVLDGYFEEYAEQLAADVGAIDSDAGWPLMHIDWEAAANNLQQDYTSLEYGDETYWVR